MLEGCEEVTFTKEVSIAGVAGRDTSSFGEDGRH